MEDLEGCKASGSNNIIAGAGANVVLQNFTSENEHFNHIVGFLTNEMKVWTSSVTELKSLMNNNELNKNKENNELPSITQGDHSTIISNTGEGDINVYNNDCKGLQMTIEAQNEEIRLLRELLDSYRQEKDNKKSK
jgi:hypothetical protein